MSKLAPPLQWLVLAYQLPATPSQLRVRIWRRLQQLGAAVLRNSMYVLPLSAESREDFEWIRSEIVAHKGQASLLTATAVDGYTDAELIGQLRSARVAEYEAIAKEARAAHKNRPASGRGHATTSQGQAVRKLRERLAAIVARDHLGAPGREAAEAAINDLQRPPDGGVAGALEGPRLRAKDFRRSVWLTRPRPGIDRMASAWLIRRFVASDARFVFASRLADGPRGAIAFDMPDVEFGHHGARCTFETLTARFAIADRAVAQIGEIVHDLDLKETRYGRPETLAIGRIVEGLRAMSGADAELLDRGMFVIEALYQSLAAPQTAAAGRARGRTH